MPRNVPALVSAGPDGEIQANYAKYYRGAVAIAWESCGGQERFNDWASKNYADFVKTFVSKQIPRETEISASDSVEDLLRRLDAGEHAQVIEGEAHEVD
jgi:hypothetical protein